VETPGRSGDGQFLFAAMVGDPGHLRGNESVTDWGGPVGYPRENATSLEPTGGSHMMSVENTEKRGIQRYRKRFQVRFDAMGVAGTGFTGNVSPTGMRIHSKLAPTPGSILRGMLFLHDSAPMEFRAQVRWVHKAAGPLVQLFQSAMGLKFVVPPGENYFRLLLKSSIPE